jgi:D-alanyl-D-alanine endopeptidase (penicillin-binding protein 7)
MRSWREIGWSLVATCLVSGVATPPAAAASATPPPRPQPEVHSHAFYVLDETRATVLAARHETTPVPIASITKLMTALVVLEGGQPLDEVLTITRADLDGTVGGSSRIPLGARLTRSDMLRLALMSSENRSTHALCRSYPGGVPACVKAMNARAAGLGMRTARFVEPTGLSSRNVASPADLAKLVLASGANPIIREYSTAREYTVVVKGQPLEYRNSNLLVKNPEWQVNVQKTGYISEAGRCLVMQTVIGGRDVVIVLLNSWGTLTRIADAKRIRTWMEQQDRRG